MEYSDFLNSMYVFITQFFVWCGTITSNLLTNYVFITLVGLTIMPVLFYIFVSNITGFNILHKRNKKNLDNGGKKQ